MEKEEIEKRIKLTILGIQIETNLKNMQVEIDKIVNVGNVEGLQIYNNYLEQGVEILKEINNNKKRT